MNYVRNRTFRNLSHEAKKAVPGLARIVKALVGFSKNAWDRGGGGTARL